jgi:UDP-glucose 4-epimerase
MEEVFAAERPDIVNHHAAQMNVTLAVREPLLDAETNIVASIHLLNLSVKYGVRRLIYISTAGAAYGEPRSIPVDETHPVNPITPYGISKHTVEHYLFTYRVLYGLPYVVLRYGNVYGPRQSSEGEAGVVAIFCEQMLRNITPRIFGNGSKTRDYVFVSDIGAANVLALTKGEGEIFGLANGVAVTDDEIFTCVREALGIPPFKPHYVPKRPGEIDHIVMNISKARSGLEWQPKVQLKQGIKVTADSFRQLSRSQGSPV